MKAQQTQPTTLHLHANPVNLFTCSVAELRISAQQLLTTLDDYMQYAADQNLHGLSNEYANLYHKVDTVHRTLNSQSHSAFIAIRCFLKTAWDFLPKPIGSCAFVKHGKHVLIKEYKPELNARMNTLTFMRTTDIRKISTPRKKPAQIVTLALIKGGVA